MVYKTGLDYCTSHSGYSAEEAKNIGKMTKFITPAKFSSWRMTDDMKRARDPSISPARISAGTRVRYPANGSSNSGTENNGVMTGSVIFPNTPPSHAGAS